MKTQRAAMRRPETTRSLHRRSLLPRQLLRERRLLCCPDGARDRDLRRRRQELQRDDQCYLLGRRLRKLWWIERSVLLQFPLHGSEHHLPGRDHAGRAVGLRSLRQSDAALLRSLALGRRNL